MSIALVLFPLIFSVGRVCKSLLVCSSRIEFILVTWVLCQQGRTTSHFFLSTYLGILRGNVGMTRGLNTQRYTYVTGTWVLCALPGSTCGCMASCRGHSGKRQVKLGQCRTLIGITSHLRYGVVMLTPRALRTSAGDRYQVDTSDKPHA